VSTRANQIDNETRTWAVSLRLYQPQRVIRDYDCFGFDLWMVVALSRGLPVRFKSARVVLVAGERRPLLGTLARMGMADICCVSEMTAAKALCDAGSVDACLVVLPRAVPDEKPSWDARSDAPGRGRVPSLLFADAATPYVRRAAANAGYHAVIPADVSSRILYRCIGALLQAGGRPDGAGGKPRRSLRGRTRGAGGVRALGGEFFNAGKPKLQ
jgi:hypothetical protein